MSHHRNDAWCVEKHEVSPSCLVGGVAYQGRASKMEDNFKIIPNINGGDISIYGMFDGHAGEFASKYACDIIMPCISEKIGNILDIIAQKTSKIVKENKANEEENEELPISVDPLEIYITNDNRINYESLLNDEILSADKVLNERLAKAVQFCGTTFCLVLVDITNKLIVCANVGDSRAVLCSTKNLAVQLSFDHKPNNPDEMKRIKENGGYVSNKEGCWRVEGSLATSRTIGDYPLKMKKVITAQPDFQIKRYTDFK